MAVSTASLLSTAVVTRFSAMLGGADAGYRLSRYPSCHFTQTPTTPNRTPFNKTERISSKYELQTFALSKDADDGILRNVQDTDEAFDDLFNKYGKVVFRSNDKKSPTAEVDDDAESLAFAVAMAKVASDVKAADIKVLFVKPLVYWTRFFIIATAFSRPQVDAIRSRMRDLAEKSYGKVSTGDTKPNSWTLLDFGDAVVHIFLPEQRAFYNLEEFYANATPIELPFENEPPLRS